MVTLSRRVSAMIRTARILWAALLFSTLILLFVLIQVRAHGGGSPAPPDPVMKLGLGVVALATAIVAVLFPRSALRQGLRRIDHSTLNTVDAALRAAFPVYQTTLILGMALAESVALFGFVLVFLGEPLLTGAPFFVVAWGIMLSKAPSARGLVRAFERATGAILR